MAQVTVELRKLLTTNFKLFDFDYQFDDPTFKEQLEQYVLDFYYDYEIGQDTPDMFKRKFVARWKRTIPYYNRLYNTTLLQYNPLINSKMSEALEQLSNTSNTTDSTHTNKSDSTTTSNANSHSFSDGTTKASDYPQQPIAGGDYLSGESNNLSDTTSEDSSTTTSGNTGSSTDKVIGAGTSNSEYTKTIEGMTGTTYQELIMKERETLLRIQDQIIEEMKPCFILVH